MSFFANASRKRKRASLAANNRWLTSSTATENVEFGSQTVNPVMVDSATQTELMNSSDSFLPLDPLSSLPLLAPLDINFGELGLERLSQDSVPSNEVKNGVLLKELENVYIEKKFDVNNLTDNPLYISTQKNMRVF